jgi:hypothetical protein
MPESDKGNWLIRHKWLVAYIATAIGALFTQFHHIEPNAKRMAELAGLYKPVAPPSLPAPKVMAEAPKLPPAPPPKPGVPPLRNVNDMRDMFRGLAGDKWEPHFNNHFKNRETAFVLGLTEIENADGGRFKFEGDASHENWRPTFYVLPRNRADLKKFKPGMRLLIEGDLDRYLDTGSGPPDIVIVLRARVTDPNVTGSINK